MANEETDRLHPAVPHRQVRDAATLRALAHPVRVQLLEELLQYGPATATELAERIGDTQANCSWHLRQLHKYGLVESAEGGKGRQRPWRFVRQTVSLDVWDYEPDVANGPVKDAMWNVLIERELQALRQWRTSKHQETATWREAATEWQTWGWLTATEFADFTRELNELADRYVLATIDRVDPDRRPPGCRPIRFNAWAIPGGPDSETPEGEQ
ncbi:ArsR/SmtB family transcription factor [Flindersiella endophytica]